MLFFCTDFPKWGYIFVVIAIILIIPGIILCVFYYCHKNQPRSKGVSVCILYVYCIREDYNIFPLT